MSSAANINVISVNFLPGRVQWFYILKWVDAHANLPVRARWIAKADVALQGANKRACVDPPKTEGFLFPASIIDSATCQAYLETHYHVLGDTPLTLQVGLANPSLAALYKALRVESCAFVTACNPWSQLLESPVNAQRRAVLASELRQRSLRFVDGIGQHPSGQWPGEASFLIWNLSLEAAKALGAKYEQNAIIWCELDAVPQLILLR